MATIRTLINHHDYRVRRDRSIDHYRNFAERTEMFLDIEGIIGMLDGKKQMNLQPGDVLDQNADYNGWTAYIDRNFILI